MFDINTFTYPSSKKLVELEDADDWAHDGSALHVALQLAWKACTEQHVGSIVIGSSMTNAQMVSDLIFSSPDMQQPSGHIDFNRQVFNAYAEQLEHLPLYLNDEHHLNFAEIENLINYTKEQSSVPIKYVFLEYCSLYRRTRKPLLAIAQRCKVGIVVVPYVNYDVGDGLYDDIETYEGEKYDEEQVQKTIKEKIMELFTK